MPHKVQEKIRDFIQSWHPLTSWGEHISFHGAKTVERIRSSPWLRTWLVRGDNTTRVAENTKLMNEWRCSMSKDTEEGREWMLVHADAKT